MKHNKITNYLNNHSDITLRSIVMMRLGLCLLMLMMLTGLFAQIADPWGNPTIYGTGMSIVVKVKINGIDATSSDILTAYVGNQLRAKTSLVNYSPPVNGVGRTFLIQTVTPNETIVFKVWDHSEQRVYISSVNIQSIPGGTIGSYPSNIYEINATIQTQTISGNVSNEGQALSAIPIQIASISPAQTFNTYKTLTTNLNGDYMIPEILSGSSITFFPNSLLYNFSPTQYHIESVNVNHICNFVSIIIPQYTLSGTVSANNQPLAGAVIHAGPFSAVSGVDGTYSLSVPGNSDYTVYATKTGWDFNPSQYQFSPLTGNQSNLDFSGSLWQFNISGNSGVGQSLIQTVSTGSNVYPDQISDDAGNFVIPGIYYGDTVTVTPSKTGYSFQPPNRTINQISAHQEISFQASVLIFTISGTINDNGLPVNGVNINYQNGSTQTDQNGFYSFTLPWHSNVVMTFEKTGYNFNPASITISNIEQNQVHHITAVPIPQYLVSGFVFKEDMSPVANCAVIIGEETSLTNQNGYYSFNLYESNETLSIHAFLDGYHFNPAQINLNGLHQHTSNQNFTAIINRYSISGQVSAVEAVTLTMSGDLNASTLTDGNGQYIFNNVPHFSSVLIVPSKANHHFTPQQIAINNLSSDLSNQNFTGALDTLLVQIQVLHQGNPLSAVSVDHNGTISLTNAQGLCEFYLPYGAACTIQISRAGYYFDNPQINILAITSAQYFTVNTRLPYIYTVSGQVLHNQSPLSDVTINYNNYTTSTNLQGFYSFNVTENQNVSIIPGKTGYLFTPNTVTFNNVNQNQTQNFTASLIPYTVSGSISNNGVPISNCKVYFLSDSTYTDNNGVYLLTAPFGSNLMIRPSDPAYTFDPVQIQINPLVQNMQNQNFQATRKTFSVSGYVHWNNQPLSNVLVYSGTDGFSTMTNDQGYYQLNLFYGTTSFIYAQKPYFVFNPLSYSVNNLTQNISQLDFTATAQVHHPQFNPAPGTYTSPQVIHISCPTDSVLMYYTLDNSEPNQGSIPYTNGIVTAPETDYRIRVKAYRSGYLPSETVLGEYFITGQVSSPVISHQSGTYQQAIYVSVTSAPGTTVHYTSNGNTPTSSDSVYSQPIYINRNCTLKVRAFKTDYIPSNPVSRNYQFEHHISLNLPDSVQVNENTPITLNLRNYISDSVSGNHPYLVTIHSDQGILTFEQNLFLHISPQNNWTGSARLFVNISLPEEMGSVSASDSMLVIVRPVNASPVIVSYSPVENVLNLNAGSLQNFVVNATDNDSELFYEWLINGVSQGVETPYFYYTVPASGVYQVKCEVTDLNYTLSKVWTVNVILGADIPPLPSDYALRQNFPNPFNPETRITFSLPQREYVEISVYNVKGQEINTLVSEIKEAGEHHIVWNARDSQGKTLQSGIYLYKIKAGNFHAIRKAILIK